MSMAVSHHAAAFPDGLQDVNNCRRVTVVGFKTLFPRKEEDHGAGRGTETPRRDERSSEAHCRNTSESLASQLPALHPL
ncbi:hypothetical protein Bca101_094087 [Brassica carinata]